jgi:hypothetical protein
VRSTIIVRGGRAVIWLGRIRAPVIVVAPVRQARNWSKSTAASAELLISDKSFTNSGSLGFSSRSIRFVSIDPSVIDLVNRQGDTEGREWLCRVLDLLDELECQPFVPPAQNLRYLNVRPSAGAGSHRLCSIHVRTGRVEFQTGTHPLAVSSGLTRLELVPKGDKAAVTPRSDEDLRQIRILALAELTRRCGLS